MNLYKESTFRSEVVTQGLLGESCSILEQSDNWTRIKQWDGYEGWANNFYGIIQDEVYSTTHSFFGHSCEIVDTVGKGIRTMNFGGKVEAEQTDKNYSITLPDGDVGYLESNLYVDALIPSRDSIVNVAQSFLGIPYRWGGKSTLGFDCSGLVQSVFKAHDISLPRDSHEQADQFVNEISLDEVAPGDLLFFAEQSKISHVAISLGDDNLVNARGWVRQESIEPSSAVFCQKLKDLYVKAASIDEVVKN